MSTDTRSKSISAFRTGAAQFLSGNSRFRKHHAPLLLAALALLLATPSAAHAVTWLGATNASWATSTNWSGGSVPGSGNTATFSNAGGAVDVISLGSGITIGKIVFTSGSAAAYTIGSGAVGSQTLTFDSFNDIVTMNSTVSNNQLINAASVIGSGTSNETFFLTNYSTTKSLTFAGGISSGTNTGTKTIEVSGSGNTIISGVVGNGSGTVAINITSSGTTTLSGNNTYTGPTVMLLSGATLILSGSNSGSGGVDVANGFQQLNINHAHALGSGTLAIAPGNTIDNTSGAPITVATNNPISLTFTGNTTFGGSNDLNLGTGAITGDIGRTFTLNGSNKTLTMGGTFSNTNDANNTLTVDGTGNTLSLGGINIAPAASGTSRTLTIAGSANVNITGAIANGGTAANALTYSGSGTLTLSGSNTYTGATTISAGTLQVGSGTTDGSIASSSILNNSALAYNLVGAQTYSGVISGTGTLAKSGVGALTLAGSNSYTGGTTITGGTLVLAAGGVINHPNADVIVATSGNGSLLFNGGSVTGSTGFVGYFGGSNGTSTVSSGTWNTMGSLFVGRSGTGTLNINGGTVADLAGNLGNFAGSNGTANVTSGSWSNTSSLFVGVIGNGTLNINGGSVSSSTAQLGVFAGSSGTVTVTSGTWSNSSNLTIGSSGTGTLNLTGSGVVTVNSGAGTVTIASGTSGVGTLNLGTGGTAGALNVATVNGGLGTGTVNFNHTSSGYTFSPRLTGALSVNQTGTGTTILTGSNTYTGATTITSGTLGLFGAGALSGSTAKLSVTGATLDMSVDGAANTYNLVQ